MRSLAALALLAGCLAGCGGGEEAPAAAPAPRAATAADDPAVGAVRRRVVDEVVQTLALPGCAPGVAFTRERLRRTTAATTEFLATRGIAEPVSERLRLACEAPALNLVVGRNRGGEPGVRATLVGETRTAVPLQLDALKAAVAAAERSAARPGAACRGFLVRDTKAGTEEAAGAGRRWSEVWTIDRCGAVTDVVLRFENDPARGVTFSARRAAGASAGT